MCTNMLLTTCPETRCPQKGARVTFLFSTRPFAWQEECAAREPALCPSWLLFFQLLNVTGSSEISPTALQASHSPGGFAPLEKEQRGVPSLIPTPSIDSPSAPGGEQPVPLEGQSVLLLHFCLGVLLLASLSCEPAQLLSTTRNKFISHPIRASRTAIILFPSPDKTS